jgi:cytochrome P450
MVDGGPPVSGTPSRDVHVARMRGAMRGAVGASSLRTVADEVEMSEAWVRRFLAGANPHPGTRQKLEAWYARVRAERANEALAALVEDLPEGRRERVREDLLEVLRDAHRKLGTDPPGWLAND